MPSHQTAKKETVKVQVLAAIGVDATPELIEEQRLRAKRKGIQFQGEGLTMTIYPNKRVRTEDGKHWIEPEPVYVELEHKAAKKLSEAGKVRVAL